MMMPTFLHNFEYSGTSYEDKRLFHVGDEVPADLLDNPIVMWYTDRPIYVPPKVGTPEHAQAERDRRMQKAEDAAHQRRQEEQRREAEQAAVNEQKAKALAEAAGLGDYAPGALPGAQAPARTAPAPLRQPLRQPLGPRRASN
jgi:hypothetical protein